MYQMLSSFLSNPCSCRRIIDSFEYVLASDCSIGRFSVRLQGDRVVYSWLEYQHFKWMEHVVLIVQYGLIKKEGDEVSIVSFNYATRVFWNPTFNDIIHLRRELLTRRGRV